MSTTGSAVFSACGGYRYLLSRDLRAAPQPQGAAPAPSGRVVFLMLNPSTADATADDPTIRRCRGFARRLGAAQLDVVNLYAWRATAPRDLWRAADPVGPDNDAWLRRTCADASAIIAAWGANARPDRAAAVLALLRDLGCGGRLYRLGAPTKAGHPRHPLYLRRDTPLEPLTA